MTDCDFKANTKKQKVLFTRKQQRQQQQQRPISIPLQKVILLATLLCGQNTLNIFTCFLLQKKVLQIAFLDKENKEKYIFR